jgi:DNA-binding CsgD family transcriptional regulator
MYAAIANFEPEDVRPETSDGGGVEALCVAGRGGDSFARELGCFLQTLARHQNTSAALCVLWPGCLAAEVDRKTNSMTDWRESLASVQAPDLFRSFAIDLQGARSSEPVFMPAHAVKSRLSSVAPALSRARVLRDQLVLGVPLRRPGGGLRGFAAVSVPHLVHRRDVGWYEGCCDLFASTWLEDVAPRPPASEPCLEPAAPLSRREMEVARLLADGYSLVNAAAVLGLSENTARTYLKRMYAKLGVCNRVQLVRRLGA